MENYAQEILVLSSDLETGAEDYECWKDEYSYWLSTILADDEAVAGRAISDPLESNLLHLKPVTENADCEDDDCVILDGEPDKLFAVGDGGVNSDDSDDLQVIGEKGQVACRDFPHPRHLCAKFPFASTPHERVCDQCHCYVCDSLAPCALWGTGLSSLDHCHATEKEEPWRAQRESLKKGNVVPPALPSAENDLLQTTQVPPLTPLPPISLPQTRNIILPPTCPLSMSINNTIPNTMNQGRSQLPGISVPPVLPSADNDPFLRRLPETTQVPPSTPLLPVSLPQTQNVVLAPTRPLPMSIYNIIPNTINQGRSQLPGFSVPRNGFHPHLVAQQLSNMNTNTINQGRSQLPELSVPRSRFQPHFVAQQLSNMNTNTINQGRSQLPGLSVPRSRFQPHLVAQQLSNMYSDGTSSATNQNGWKRGPWFINPHAAFKRNGAAVNNSCGYNKRNYGPKTSLDPFLKSCLASPDQGANTYGGGYQPSIGSHPNDTVYYRQGVSVLPNIGGCRPNYLLSQLQMSFQTYASARVTTTTVSHPQMSSRPFFSQNLVNVRPLQSQVASQLNLGSNTGNSIEPLQTLSNQSNIGSGLQNHFYQSSIISQPNMVKAYQNYSPSLPKADGYPNIVPNGGQNTFQQGNETGSGFNTGFTDFTRNLDVRLNHSNNQQLLAVSFQHQHATPNQKTVTTEDNAHQQSGALGDDSGWQFVAPADNLFLTDEIASLFPGISD